MRLAGSLVLVVVLAYVAWTAAIADRAENTVWTALLSAVFYGALLALLVMGARALVRRRR